MEVVFTAIWEFLAGGSLRLMGETSLWSFLIYGLGIFLAAELIRGPLVALHVPTWARCLLYVPLIYAWEFSFALLLQYFDARPWDYSGFDYNIMGLITLEYAPVWFMGGAYVEFFVSCMSTLEQKPVWRQKLE